MKVPQAVRLVPPEGKESGEIIVMLPMDVTLFGRVTAALGKAGWLLVDRRQDVPAELADVPDLYFEIAKLAWEGVTYDGERNKQWCLAEILERCGVQFPEQLERGVPA